MLVFVFFVHSAHLLSYDLGGDIVLLERQDGWVGSSDSGQDAFALPHFHDRQDAEAVLDKDEVKVLRCAVRMAMEDTSPESQDEIT